MDREETTTEVRRETVHPDDVRNTNETTVTDRKVPGNVLAQRIVYYIGGFILGLLALRFILALLGAAEGNAFVDFIYGLSGIFVWPFYGIFGEPTLGESQFETSTLVAMAVYGLLTVAIAKLFTINSANRDVA